MRRNGMTSQMCFNKLRNGYKRSWYWMTEKIEKHVFITIVSMNSSYHVELLYFSFTGLFGKQEEICGPWFS